MGTRYKNYFTMDEQCCKEYLSVHEKCFNIFFKNSKDKQLISLNRISFNNKKYKDWEYTFLYIPKNVKMQGFLECKHDSWDSYYMVSEIFGSVDMNLMNKDVIKDVFSKRISLEKNPKCYNYLHSFVKENINNKNIGIGYGFASDDAIGQCALFAYYNRAVKRERKNGKLVETKDVLKRNWYLIVGKKIRDMTIDCFNEKKYFLQITPNYDKKNGNAWISINQLIPYSYFKKKCICSFNLENHVSDN